MAKAKFRLGDKVKVIGMPPFKFAPGVKDEMGTKRLFKSMLGKVYTIRGFDKIGNVELEPKRPNTVWIEPEFLRLREIPKVIPRRSRVRLVSVDKRIPAGTRKLVVDSVSMPRTQSAAFRELTRRDAHFVENGMAFGG